MICMPNAQLFHMYLSVVHLQKHSWECFYLGQQERLCEIIPSTGTFSWVVEGTYHGVVWACCVCLVCFVCLSGGFYFWFLVCVYFSQV